VGSYDAREILFICCTAMATATFTAAARFFSFFSSVIITANSRIYSRHKDNVAVF
jgi:hypothetical protein